MINLRKNPAIIFISILTIIVLFITSTFAWMLNYIALQTTVNSGVIARYFHCGDGTQNNPYVITRPIHFYHMIELYTRKWEDYALDTVYYQIGYDFNNNGTYQVYEYNNNGVPTGNYSTTLNMNSYESLLPIGTSITPFSSKLDGKGIDVSNLHISGNGLCDIGIFGFVSSSAEISNIYFSNVDISVDGVSNYSSALASITSETHPPHDEITYVGYLVGHIQNAASIQDVYINNCSINGTVAVAGVKNEWGYYGRCDGAASLETFVAIRVGGANTGWGESVDMNTLFNRVSGIRSRSSTLNNYVYDKANYHNLDSTTTTATILESTAYYYNANYVGHFLFTEKTSSTDYIYLSGGQNVKTYEEYLTGNTLTGYYIKSGSNYLSVVNGALSNVTSQSSATLWSFSRTPSNNANVTISTKVDGTTYYLYIQSSGWSTRRLQLSTNSTTFKVGTSGSNYTLTYSTSGWSSTTYYIVYNSGWTIQTSSGTVSLQSDSIAETAYREVSSVMDYSSQYVTYFPLLVNNNNTAKSTNTGYIVSGSDDRTTSGTYPRKSGDIRISRYNISNISGSYSNGSFSNIYTIDKNGVRQTVSAGYSSTFDSAKINFSSVLSGSSYVYGLHFMSAAISEDSLVSADYVRLQGEEYTNYQLPTNSIDFLVNKKGSINFFAGTYFSNNNSFFSLHHIERDENNNIVSIREIKRVYSDGVKNHPYVYEYEDGGWSDIVPVDYAFDYVCVFENTQIKINTLTTNSIYYFEIPINAGEYALGSVENGTGAYLLYLDIATNGGTDDGEGDVSDFESVEYRTKPDEIDTSILLISYEQPEDSTIDVTTSYANNVYTIDFTCDKSIIVYVTLLRNDYTVVVNGITYQGVQTFTIGGAE